MSLYFYSSPTIHTADCKVIPLSCADDQAFYTDAHGKKVIVGAMTCVSGVSAGADEIAQAVWEYNARTLTSGGSSVVICGGLSADIESGELSADIDESELSGELTCRV